jgi:hypothetical protein
MIIPGFIKESTPLKIPEYRKQRANFFQGAFYVSGSSDGINLNIQVDRGFVNGLEPVTDSGDLIGGAGDGQPSLQLKVSYDDADRCYICLRLGIDPATGLMKARKQADVTMETLGIVAVDDFHSDDPAVHYHPIAIDHKDHGLRQLSYHDLLHATVKQYGSFRHFMLAS